jgi:hypothetical protein
LTKANSQKEFWKKLKKSFPAKCETSREIDGLASSDPNLPDRFEACYKNVFNQYEADIDKAKLEALLTTPPPYTKRVISGAKTTS